MEAKKKKLLHKDGGCACRSGEEGRNAYQKSLPAQQFLKFEIFRIPRHFSLRILISLLLTRIQVILLSKPFQLRMTFIGPEKKRETDELMFYSIYFSCI